MPEGRRFDDYVEEYRVTADEAELEAFNAYTDAFRLANQILTARKRNGLTQVELASRSGIAQSEISRIERGAGKLPIRQLDPVLGHDSVHVPHVIRTHLVAQAP